MASGSQKLIWFSLGGLLGGAAWWLYRMDRAAGISPPPAPMLPAPMLADSSFIPPFRLVGDDGFTQTSNLSGKTFPTVEAALNWFNVSFSTQEKCQLCRDAAPLGATSAKAIYAIDAAGNIVADRGIACDWICFKAGMV